jgi:parvulin-like peptidyl-prolyl isomerase
MIFHINSYRYTDRMRNLILWCLWLFFLFALPACPPKTGSSRAVVIRVGERSITAGDIERIVEITSLENGIPKRQVWSSIESLVDRIVDDALICQHGRDRGITVTEIELERAIQDIVKDYPEGTFEETLLNRCIDYTEWKRRFREQLLIKKIVEEQAESLDPIPYHAIKSYYEEREEEFWHPPRAKFIHIVTKTRGEAEALLARLQAGEDMTTLMKEQSSQSALQGDSVRNWATRGALPPTLADVVFSIPVGETSSISETPYGYHIIRVLEREPKGRKELLEVMGEIEKRLLSNARETHYSAWLEQLRNNYPVRIDHALLEKIRALHEGN